MTKPTRRKLNLIEAILTENPQYADIVDKLTKEGKSRWPAVRNAFEKWQETHPRQDAA